MAPLKRYVFHFRGKRIATHFCILIWILEIIISDTLQNQFFCFPRREMFRFTTITDSTYIYFCCVCVIWLISLAQCACRFVRRVNYHKSMLLYTLHLSESLYIYSKLYFCSLSLSPNLLIQYHTKTFLYQFQLCKRQHFRRTYGIP